jgi:hypothetical protein
MAAIERKQVVLYPELPVLPFFISSNDLFVWNYLSWFMFNQTFKDKRPFKIRKLIYFLMNIILEVDSFYDGLFFPDITIWNIQMHLLRASDFVFQFYIHPILEYFGNHFSFLLFIELGTNPTPTLHQGYFNPTPAILKPRLGIAFV